MTRLFFILFVLVNLSGGSLESDLASIPTFPYIENEWDCSEMSFFAQHELEEMGYNAQVAVCNTYPRHAWVLVVTEKRVIAVEATTMEIIPFRPDFSQVFRNSTDAMRQGIPISRSIGGIIWKLMNGMPGCCGDRDTQCR